MREKIMENGKRIKNCLNYWMKQSGSSFRIASLAMLCNSDFLIAFHRLCFKAFGLVVAMNFV